MLTERIKALSNQHFEAVAELRHRIHMHPELGYDEHATSRLIAEVLGSLGIPTRTGVAETGVVGLIQGRGPGRTVLLRADMDALPIQEEVDVPFRSQIKGRMHACGHDGHVAGLLGAAMVLNGLRDSFDGNVKLVFQPAEETDGGASRMIEEGVLENPKVDAAFGCHLWGPVEEGKVQLCPGPMMASPNTFKFKIFGKGGHGAYPHLTVDPIVLGAQAITFFQSIVSRRINPLEPVVLTIASIHSGETTNVIPGVLEAQGTIRTFNEALRDVIPMEMESILKGITESQGASYTFEYRKSYPPLINDPGMTEVMRGAFAKLAGAEQVNAAGTPSMGAEDFGYFAKAVPSAFAFVGIGKPGCEPMVHHQPHFQWDDRNLLLLMGGLAQVAVDFLQSSSAQ
ncbi:MAG: M20 family metallopeptidase [Holophaga sp.]|nr:M20 family metallopeptidase [Holophaga sp.]